MAENGLLDEIFVALGFKVDEKKVKNFDKSVKSTVASLKKAVVGVGATVIAIDRLTNSLLKANQAYLNFNQQTGISIDKINKLVGAGMLANYSLTAEGMMGSIQALQMNLAQIKLGQGNIAPFQMLGISPVGKDAAQVIEELRVAIRGISDADAVNLIQQMGLSPDFISLLRLTTEEMKEFEAATARIQLSRDQREALNKFATDMRLIHMEMAYWKDRTLVSIAPYLIRFMQSINHILEFLYEYRKIIAWIGGLGALGFVGGILKMDKAVKLLGLTIDRTFLKWLAALTAIYLILEDIAVWRMGGQSLIGDLYEWGKRGFTNGPTTDELYEQVYNRKRSNLGRYLDWVSSGGPLGSLAKPLFGFSPERDFYNNMLRMQTDGNMGSLTSNKNVEQNNYISISGDNMVSGLVNKATDLMFTAMQADRSL